MNKLLRILTAGPGGASPLADFGLLITRVGVGVIMAFGHGLSKVWRAGEFGPPQQLIEGVGKMGFPAPTAFAWAAALTEFLGAILLALGLFTRPVALALTFNMAVAAFVAHGKDPWFNTGAGPAKEAALMFLLPFLLFVFTGAGRFSMDALLNRRQDKRRGFDVEP